MKKLKKLSILFLALLLFPLVANATISNPCSLTTYDGSTAYPADPGTTSLTEVYSSGGETVTFPAGTEAVFLALDGLPPNLPIQVTEATGAICSEVLSGTGSLYLGLVDAKGIAQIVLPVLPGDGSVSFRLSYGRIFPVADAGTDRTVPALRKVLLDARPSYDPDTIATLQYSWNLTERPYGSQASLSDPGVATPSFVPDILGDYVIELVVTDGYRLESTPVSVTITATNSEPVAEAGDDQTVAVGSTVTLDGCHSFDAESDTLTYVWNIGDAPIESRVFLTGADSCAPTFVADASGSYVFELVVRDGFESESTDTVTITASSNTSNTQPTAKAGSAQTVHVGTLATLDGSASSDPDGDPIAYAWKFQSRPDGSKATLSDANTVSPTFRPDLQGSYRVELVVTDSAGLQSTATVTVSTSNSQPKAEAGPEQAVTLVDTTVTLDGRQSSDPDGDDLAFAWTLMSKPQESSAQMIDATLAQPSFVADVYGDYIVRLVVSDPWSASEPDLVKVSFNNIKPVAAVVSSKSGIVDDPVTLDGKTSTDANGDALTYLWGIISLPARSTARIADPTAELTTFTPDRPGTYVVQLIVNDGLASSNPSTATIQVVSEQTAAVTSIQELQTQISLLEPRAFRQPVMKRLLNLELNLVLAAVERGRYRTALTLLTSGVLPSTDGCATRGAPDRQDWIVDCAAQRMVYPELQEIIAMLREML